MALGSPGTVTGGFLILNPMKLYFIYLGKRNSAGEKINGQYWGLDGWSEGYHGPHTEKRVRELSARVGGLIKEVEVKSLDRLIELVKGDEEAKAAPDSKEDAPKPRRRRTTKK